MRKYFDGEIGKPRQRVGSARVSRANQLKGDNAFFALKDGIVEPHRANTVVDT